MLLLASISFLPLKVEVQPIDTCFISIFSLKYAMCTVPKWFNAVATIVHFANMIQLQCKVCNVIQYGCNDCAFFKRETNWFAHFITYSLQYFAPCNIYCCKSSLVLHALPFGDLFLPFIKTSQSLCKTATGRAKKIFSCPTFAALYMRVI